MGHTMQKMWDIFLTVLYGCEVSSLMSIQEQNRLKMFNKRVPEECIGRNRQEDESVNIAS